MAALDQLLERLAVALGAFALEDGLAVPVELEPAQGVEDLLDVLLGGALPVGILDPQYELAPLLAGEEPVEERRARAADVERARGRRSESNSDGHGSGMLIGAHVSTAGGLVNAHARGLEIGADAIQVFNQSPRMWKPTRWKDDDVAAFLELMDGGPIGSIVIHAVYLINCASKDPEIREKSLISLKHSLRMGDAIAADGVVLHPGSTVGEPHAEALERVGEVLREALAETGRAVSYTHLTLPTTPYV